MAPHFYPAPCPACCVDRKEILSDEDAQEKRLGRTQDIALRVNKHTEMQIAKVAKELSEMKLMMLDSLGKK